MSQEMNQFDIQKQLVRASSNGFLLNDMTPMVNMGNLAEPSLLTVLMGGADTTSRIFLDGTNIFEYDEVDYTPALMNGKAFSDKGNRIKKDRPKNRFFEVGSKGISLNVSPKDIMRRRRPGSNEQLAMEDVLNDQINKAQRAVAFEEELESASILTTGTNRTAGGPFTSYDYHNDILGSSRPAATTINFAGTDPVASTAIRNRTLVMGNRAAKYGLRVTGYDVIAGDNFFNAAFEYEKKTTLARDLRTTIDLATQAVPTIDNGGFRYDNFESPLSGVRYIRYSASLGGSQLIADNDAYLIPRLSGDTLIRKVYAPAQTTQYVRSVAQELYSWFYEDEFEGVTGFYEQNSLMALVRPDLIEKLDIA